MTGLEVLLTQKNPAGQTTRVDLVILPLQVTPTSSVWPQLLLPQPANGQLNSDASEPEHATSSIKMLPDPPPTVLEEEDVPSKPRVRQATTASDVPKLSSHTVPQVFELSTSKRPENGPGTRRALVIDRMPGQ
jgi:hypothetical protein